MGEFLYGLIRMLKPDLVVETGCYKGGATRAMARAIIDNGFGVECRVVTCENHYPNPFTPEENIDWRNCSSFDLPELRTADFVFSDSDHDIRPVEYALVKKGCVFVVHDTDQPYYGDPPFLGEWVKGMGGLVFHAGRGFGLLIK